MREWRVTTGSYERAAPLAGWSMRPLSPLPGPHSLFTGICGHEFSVTLQRKTHARVPRIPRLTRISKNQCVHLVEISCSYPLPSTLSL